MYETSKLCDAVYVHITLLLISIKNIMNLYDIYCSNRNVKAQVVSASDVMPTLAKSLMHMAHKSRNTSGVSKMSLDWLNYTGFLRDLCVAFTEKSMQCNMYK